MNTLRLLHKIGLCIVLLGLGVSGIRAQDLGLNLDSCQAQARRNYPLIQQFGLIKASEHFTLSNANKAYLPQLSLGAQATYQSEVTSVPIRMEGVNIPTPDKDQYRVFAEVNHSITDLVTTDDTKDLIATQSKIAAQRNEVDLHKISERVNGLYFSILLIDTQEKQLKILKHDLERARAKTEVAVNNGVALKSSLDQINASLLDITQREIELKASRKIYLEMLGAYTGQNIPADAMLERPHTQESTSEINRPELSLFNYQQIALDLQSKLVTNRALPKFGWFVQGGYGKPGLNMLNTNPESYYIGGLKLTWNLSTLYTYRSDKKLLEYQKQSVDVDRDVFLFNTNLAVSRYDAEIEKLRQLVRSDRELIALREKIADTGKNQLEFGVITTTDYLKHLNDVDDARQRLALHEIQLMMALENKKITTGN